MWCERRASGPLACLGLLAFGLPAVAGAHPLAPALLEVRELAEGRLAVAFKISSLQPPGVELAPLLPPGCGPPETHRVEPTANAVLQRFEVDCPGVELVGSRLGVSGLATAGIDALLRVELADGRLLQAVLRREAPDHIVPPRPARLEVVREYGRLGFDHIATGADHLLFLFGLLLLVAARPRPLFATVTAFTVGHSVTLCLAALGAVRFPPGPIELAIAVSVLLLAVELAREPGASPGFARRTPWLLAGGFGLLHGLGFAGALAQVGLPDGEIPLALLAFNLGIEVGQLAFLGVLLLGGYLLSRWGPALPRWARPIPAYGLGSLAAWWCFQRAATLLS